MKLTNSFYVKRIIKSESLFEFYGNAIKYWGFLNSRAINTFKFKDPFLMFR